MIALQTPGFFQELEVSFFSSHGSYEAKVSLDANEVHYGHAKTSIC
jgi:hypothetical protein